MVHKRNRTLYTLITITGLVATITFGAVRLIAFPAPPITDPDFTGPRPEIAESGYLSVTHTAFVAMPPEALHQWMVSEPLENKLIGDDTIPAVIGTELLYDSWGQPGDRRRVRLADGHQAVEEILEMHLGDSFRYQAWGWTNQASVLADYAIGQFIFKNVNGGTEVHWTYSWHPRSLITRLPLWIFVNGVWSSYMKTMLNSSISMAKANYLSFAQINGDML